VFVELLSATQIVDCLKEKMKLQEESLVDNDNLAATSYFLVLLVFEAFQ
jgi:hypothetical protein